MSELTAFLNAKEIQKLVDGLGSKITTDYRKDLKPGESLLVIVTLKGAALFAADLVRRIEIPIELDFIRAASYGGGTKSSGTVRILKDIESNLEGRHILIVDEIVDSGRTLHFLLDRLSSSRPQSLRVASLLSKPSRREVPVEIDYLGTEVDDHFLVGYGLDFGEKYRNLDGIFVLKS